VYPSIRTPTLDDEPAPPSRDTSSDVTTVYLPLPYVGLPLAYLVLAIPAGRLADRIGRGRVLLGGQALLVAVYATLLARSPGLVALLAILALMGAYYACTDGVLMAFASEPLPEHLRTSGLALLTTGVAGAQFVASLAFGALWGWFGARDALAVLTVGLALAVLVSAGLLVRTRDQIPTGSTATGGREA
jgi:MFS family permease